MKARGKRSSETLCFVMLKVIRFLDPSHNLTPYKRLPETDIYGNSSGSAENSGTITPVGRQIYIIVGVDQSANKHDENGKRQPFHMTNVS